MMKLRAWLLSGMLAAAGLLTSAPQADAQVAVTFSTGNPYGYGWMYPGAYSTPMPGYWGNPYWSAPYTTGYTNPTWGYSAPYWQGQYYNYVTPFGTQYGSYYYVNPGYGPGVYSYRFGRWGW